MKILPLLQTVGPAVGHDSFSTAVKDNNAAIDQNSDTQEEKFRISKRSCNVLFII